MSLAKVLNEIKKTIPVAKEDVDSGPVETSAVRRGRRKNAEEKLKLLKEDYIMQILKTSVFIIAAGASKDVFTKTLTSDFGCFSNDPESFYKDLVDRVPPVLYDGKESVSNLFGVLGRHLEDKAMELNVVEYPQLIFKQQYRKMITSKAEFLELVKVAINEQVGSEIVGINAVRTIVDEAIERNHADNITPIVLETKDEALAIDLAKTLKRLSHNVFLVVSGKAPRYLKAVPGALVLKEADPETVKELMGTIKKSLRK